MRENRTYGSEGGEGKPFPTPIASLAHKWRITGFGLIRPTFRQRSNDSQ
jgi:hypothetical protein